VTNLQIYDSAYRSLICRWCDIYDFCKICLQTQKMAW